MRQVQPKGPYMLGGFSGGGLTAWEMARQLKEAGEEVSLWFHGIGVTWLTAFDLRDDVALRGHTRASQVPDPAECLRRVDEADAQFHGNLASLVVHLGEKLWSQPTLLKRV